MDQLEGGDFWDFIDQLVASHELVIDRPKGSAHPRYPKYIYPLDYGYLKGTTTVDGGGIDVWLGETPPVSIKAETHISALVLTVDSFKNDAEIKIMCNCSEEELQEVVRLQNHGDMRAILVRRPDNGEKK